MSERKSWQARLASYPHLPSVKPVPEALKSGGELNPKYPGGIEAQMQQLEHEGHTVVQRGKRCLVEDFEAKLV